MLWVESLTRDVPHAHDRTLFEHLSGTRALLSSWNAENYLCDAGLGHSLYSTDSFRRKTIAWSERHVVREHFGAKAEALIFWFCCIDRTAFVTRVLKSEGNVQIVRNETIRLRRDTPPTRVRDPATGEEFLCSNMRWPAEVDPNDLLLILIANEMEQAQRSDACPGIWVSKCLSLAKKLSVKPKIFQELSASEKLSEVSLEKDMRYMYLAAYEQLLYADENGRESIQGCLQKGGDMLAEPLLIASLSCASRKDEAQAASFAQRGLIMLNLWGLHWDRRHSHDWWRQVGEKLCKCSCVDDYASALEVFREETPSQGRITDYVCRLALSEPRLMRIFPGLTAKPVWEDTSLFPICAELEKAYPQIRREIEQLDSRNFVAESESIPRSGRWEVAFIHARGRVDHDICAKLPITAAIVGNPANRCVVTMAGLAYVSRLCAHTKVEGHHGPVNMRLRCHLGIKIPSGDCGIRVGGVSCKWQEGKCIVFDDHFYHEAWNNTDEDRIVLIIDVWHAELSDDEILLLRGLHKYAQDTHASLTRYWSSNDKQRSKEYH